MQQGTEMYRIVGICLFTFFIGSMSASASDTWVTSAEKAKCFFENINEYRQLPEPVVIVIASCPILDRKEAMKELVQNNVGPTPRILKDAAGKDATIDQVIVYTHAELTCLQNSNIEVSADTIKLPKKPCE